MASKKKFDIDSSALFGDMSQADIREAVTKRPGRPQRDELVHESGSQQGLTKEFTRQTFIVEVETIETLKNYAYTERLKLKDVVADAFREYIEKHVDKDNLLQRPENW